MAHRSLLFPEGEEPLSRDHEARQCQAAFLGFALLRGGGGILHRGEPEGQPV